MGIDKVSRELARLRQTLADRFGGDAVTAEVLFKLANQLANAPQGIVLFDRLVCSIRTAEEGN